MEEVTRIKTELERAYSAKDGEKAVELMKLLFNIDVTMQILGDTHIGLTVNKIRKSFDHSESVQLATKVVRKWKKMAEQYKKQGSAAGGTGNDADTSMVTSSSGNLSISGSTNSSDNNNGAANNNTNSNNTNSITKSNEVNGNQDSASDKSKQQTSNTNNKNQAGSKSPAQDRPTSDEKQPVESTSNPHSSHLPMTNSKLNFTQREVPQTNSAVRLKFRQMICEALKKPLPKELQNQEPFLDEEELSARIEDQIFIEFKSETDMKYRNRIRSRICNLNDNKNPYLRLNVLRGDISAERIARMTADEMASDELKRQREQFTKEAINDHQMAVTSGTRSSEIKCPACKKCDTTYNQMQTRSADEPMTTFCHCNQCGKRWKFC